MEILSREELERCLDIESPSPSSLDSNSAILIKADGLIKKFISTDLMNINPGPEIPNNEDK